MFELHPWLNSLLLVVSSVAGGTFNLDELRLLQYDVEVDGSSPTTLSQSLLDRLNEENGERRPSLEERKMGEEIILGSASSQRFLCNIPPVQDLLSIAAADKVGAEKAAGELSDANLSESLSRAFPTQRPCLTKELGWWTYELCYGKWVRQYHVEGKEIRGDVLLLGQVPEDKHWTPDSLRQLIHQPRLRYHTQNYTGGTFCDLSQKLRYTQVNYYCDEELSSREAYIESVSEEVSCVYSLKVRLGSLCSLAPFRRLEKTQEPTKLICRPLLSGEEWERYEEAKDAEEAARIAQAKLAEAAAARAARKLKRMARAEQRRKAVQDAATGVYFLSLVQSSQEDFTSIMLQHYLDAYTPGLAHLPEVERWAVEVESGSSLWNWPDEIRDKYVEILFRREPHLWSVYRRLFRRYFFQRTGHYHIKWPVANWSEEESERVLRGAIVEALAKIMADWEWEHLSAEPILIEHLLRFLLGPSGLAALESQGLLYTQEELREQEQRPRLAEIRTINDKVFLHSWEAELAAQRITQAFSGPKASKDTGNLLSTLFDMDEIEMEPRLGLKSLAKSLHEMMSEMEALDEVESDILVDPLTQTESKLTDNNPFLQYVKGKKKKKDVKPKNKNSLGKIGVSIRRMEFRGRDKSQLESEVREQTQQLQAELEKELGLGGKGIAGVELKVVTAGLVSAEEGGKKQLTLNIIDPSQSQELSKLILSMMGVESPVRKEEERYARLHSGYTFNLDDAVDASDSQRRR